MERTRYERVTIFGVVGGIGTGKTLTMFYYGLQDLQVGKRLYSNVTFKVDKDLRKNLTFLTKEKIKNIFELIKTKKMNMMNSTILLQEAHNYMDSRNSSSTQNKALSYWILQSRHTGAGSCDIMFDTQRIGQVDVRLRNNTDFIIRPYITERDSDNKPINILVVFNGMIGHKTVTFSENIYVYDILDLYSTHEIVDF